MKIINFTDAVTVINSKAILKRDYKEKGIFPIVSQEIELINGYTDDSNNVINGDEGLIGFGDHTRTIKYIDFEFVKGADGLKVLKVNKEINPKYFYLWIKSLNLKDLGYARHFKLLKNFDIPVPSLQEQKIIVEKLDKAFKNIDNLCFAKKQKILLLTNMFDSFLDNTIKEFGKSEQKLGQYYDVRDGTHDSPEYYDTGYPLITSKNLKNGKVNFEKIKFISETDFNKINERSKVEKGDVLMAMIGTIGNPVVVKDDPKFAIKNVALFKLNKYQSGEYLYYFLKSPHVMKKMLKEAKGTTQKFVSLGYLRNFTISGKFNLNDENDIVKYLSKFEKIINKLIDNQEQTIVKFSELKKSILNKQFSYE